MNKNAHIALTALRSLAPGLGFTALITALALAVSATELFSRTLHIGPLFTAIIAGAVLAAAARIPDAAAPGVAFSAKRLLRAAIVLLGFRLSLSDIAHAGPAALIVIVLGSGATILFTVWLGRKINVPLKKSILLASGISICGASAVAAVDSVIEGEKEDAAFAIGAVTLFGTAAMFLYPAVFNLAHIPARDFALWAGSSIHEVAQVAAAGSAIPDPATEALASTVKMIRVLMIIPLTLILIALGRKDGARTGGKKAAMPWFALMFFAAVALNSADIIPPQIKKLLVDASGVLMTAAMAALGLGISLKRFAATGRKALLLGLAGSLFISALTFMTITMLNGMSIF